MREAKIERATSCAYFIGETLIEIGVIYKRSKERMIHIHIGYIKFYNTNN